MGFLIEFQVRVCFTNKSISLLASSDIPFTVCIYAQDCTFANVDSVSYPRPWYHWKAEKLSFFHVLLVLGITLLSIQDKLAESEGISRSN